MMVIDSFRDALGTSHKVKLFGLSIRLPQRTLSDGTIFSLSEEHLTSWLTAQPGAVDMEPKQGHAPDLAAKPLQITWVSSVVLRLAC